MNNSSDFYTSIWNKSISEAHIANFHISREKKSKSIIKSAHFHVLLLQIFL